ncbi:MAG: hypothetical protein GXO12_05765 [Epsilonproteobacteria bacterium]|nr:hypothetical protein [Campylobacterota bacterium]
MSDNKKSSLTNWIFILFFFGTIIFIIAAPIYIVNKIDKESKMPREHITRSIK